MYPEVAHPIPATKANGPYISNQICGFRIFQAFRGLGFRVQEFRGFGFRDYMLV